MKYFNFKNRNLFSGPHLLGIAFIFSGFFAIASPYFMEVGSSMVKILGIGVGAIIIGLLIVTSFSGTIIDFTHGRFREYTSIGGFKFGDWSSIPEISKIALISASYTATNTPNGISPTLIWKSDIFQDTSIFRFCETSTFFYLYIKGKSFSGCQFFSKAIQL